MRLDGKTALITGASGGLGAHFARVCAKAGADLILTARRLDRLEALAAEIKAETPQRVWCYAGDINDKAAVDELFAESEKALALPDVIINNAGLSREGWSWEISDEDWQQVIDTNLTAVWRVAKTAAQKLIAAEMSGTIINIASIVSFRTAAMVAPYGVSKAGVAHLTRLMAMELARHHIRVNALAPGYIPTDLNRAYLESEAGQRMRGRIPLKRFGTLEDLSAPLLLLASDAGSYMVGETLCVDGGHLHSSL